MGAKVKKDSTVFRKVNRFKEVRGGLWGARRFEKVRASPTTTGVVYNTKK